MRVGKEAKPRCSFDVSQKDLLGRGMAASMNTMRFIGRPAATSGPWFEMPTSATSPSTPRNASTNDLRAILIWCFRFHARRADNHARDATLLELGLQWAEFVRGIDSLVAVQRKCDHADGIPGVAGGPCLAFKDGTSLSKRWPDPTLRPRNWLNLAAGRCTIYRSRIYSGPRRWFMDGRARPVHACLIQLTGRAVSSVVREQGDWPKC
jgi:hypothetical protein